MTSLRQRMTEDMQVRNLALNTQMSYVRQVSLFARHFNKSPEALGPEDIRSYQVYLTNEKKLAPGSVLIAVAALRFLYKVSLKKDWTFEDVIPAPKKPQKLPVILSPEEVDFATLNRPTLILGFGPPVQNVNPDILFRTRTGRERRPVEQEAESGVVRADPARV
jgi:site-specific recombinase XerD